MSVELEQQFVNVPVWHFATPEALPHPVITGPPTRDRKPVMKQKGHATTTPQTPPTPQVVDASFQAAFDRIVWDDAPDLFDAWCAGRTGYPLVDAAMRQLNDSGYMHNRLRMVTASFLTKDLGIDWRRGAEYFAARLLDHDLAANNGGWQWAASTGCDAQPWFRIFIPVTQSEKFEDRKSVV